MGIMVRMSMVIVMIAMMIVMVIVVIMHIPKICSFHCIFLLTISADLVHGIENITVDI